MNELAVENFAGCVKLCTIELEPAQLENLLHECLSNDRPAVWVTFIAQFQRVIASTIIKTSRRCGQLTPGVIDDLVQETYLRLCADNYRVLRQFRASDARSFYGLLQAVAMTATLDHFRASAAGKRGGGQTPVSLEGDLPFRPPDWHSFNVVERSILLDEIDRHIRTVTPEGTAARDRRIFWRYYRHGFTAKDIAAIPSLDLSSKGVESVLNRLTSQLRTLFSSRAKGIGL